MGRNFRRERQRAFRGQPARGMTGMASQAWQSEIGMMKTLLGRFMPTAEWKQKDEYGALVPPLDWQSIADLYFDRRGRAHNKARHHNSEPLPENQLMSESMDDLWQACEDYVRMYRNNNPFHLPDEHPKADAQRASYMQEREEQRAAEIRALRRQLLENEPELQQAARRVLKTGPETATVDKPLERLQEKKLRDEKARQMHLKRMVRNGLVTSDNYPDEHGQAMLKREKERCAARNWQAALDRLNKTGAQRLDVAAYHGVGGPRRHLAW